MNKSHPRFCHQFPAAKERDFLEKHYKADEIVVDADTGRVVKAIYTTLNGVPRQNVIEYWLEEEMK